MRLTDRTQANVVTKQDFIHIVITGDTTQSPEGSSYKAQLSQIPELYKLPVPTIKLLSNHNIDPFNTVVTQNQNNTVGDTIQLINPPVIITDNITQEQVDNHIFIEMVQYKKKKGRKTNHNMGNRVSKGGGYVVQPRVETNELGTVNVLEERIMNYYGKTITNRGGIQTDYKTSSILTVDRTNHYEIFNINSNHYVGDYFTGKFTYIDLLYTNSGGGDGNVLNVPVPYSNFSKSAKHKTKSGNNGSPYELCYTGRITSLYVAFRYLMFDPEANGGKGQFVEGPLSQTIKVCNKFFPVVKTVTDGRCDSNPVFGSGDNNKLIKFSFVS